MSKHAYPLLISLVIAVSASCHEGDEHGDHHGGGNWQVLLQGDGTDAWRGYNKPELPAGWVVEEGALCLKEPGGGDVITSDKFADFEFVFEWKVSEAGNSGVMYRVSEGDHAPYVTGPEYQVLDNEKHSDNKTDLTCSGALYGLYATDRSAVKPVGQWNQAKILLDGNHLEHWLNGKKVVDCEFGSDDWKKVLSASKFADWEKFAKNRVGHIALQDHGDQVWYRNMRIRSLGGAHGEHRGDGDGDAPEREHQQKEEADHEASPTDVPQ
jgi:hypothetical protein